MGGRTNTLDDFWAQVDKVSDPAGCWLWTGCLTTMGYGTIRVAGVRHRAHRLSYRLVAGPIPKGLVLDHLCRVRHCVNPAHLEPVTDRENILRGVSVSAQNARATHCIDGHEFTAANTQVVRSTGERRCLKCSRRRQRELVARRRIAITLNPSLADHGLSVTYTGWGCRCPECKAAWSEYMRAYHLRRKPRPSRSNASDRVPT